MKILVTGSEGFIGKNLIAQLENLQAGEILKVDKDTESAAASEILPRVSVCLSFGRCRTAPRIRQNSIRGILVLHRSFWSF